jgi:DHA1 family tetracycline resistance protein-like MFS transporter
MLSGLVLAGVGLSQAVVEGFLVRPISGRFGERGTAISGYIFGALGYGTLAIAFAGWTMVPAVVLIALGGLATPSVRALVSGRGQVDNQGEMQGLLSAVEGLTAVVAPLLTAGLFYAFTAHVIPLVFPGAPFALAAGAAILAVMLLRRL